MSDHHEEELSNTAPDHPNFGLSATQDYVDSRGQPEGRVAGEDSTQGAGYTRGNGLEQGKIQRKEEPKAKLTALEEATECILQQEFPLESKVTIVEAFLTSPLNIADNKSHCTFELINAVIGTVQADQAPPILKAVVHNVDENEYRKLLKENKTSSSASQVGSPDKIALYSACARCRHDPAISTPALTLLSCGNCESAEYCGTRCQLLDWGVHKNVYCVNPDIIPASTLANPHRVPFLKTRITNPFSRLCKGIWLHDRHKHDVYVLLIDSFRLRETDDVLYGGMKNNESIYNGRVSSCPPFRRFLDQAEAKGLMPPWWSDQKRAECLTVGLNQSSENYHDLYTATHDVELLVVYEDAIILMQLRLFAEAVLGRGAAGTDGKLMREKMALAEANARALEK
ncbi:hypothetical protein Trco_001833 [Trichoderma cornu-damae]|uniref:MYND-type domain-containing protein n=1 Tax=Trichoderma cornu-damae TaxID=654480 RepID=A0A9P8QTX9_9HYPO|nr:hypothetical protein Trco_001833 [Trichoderma cornu-damae]